MKYFSLIHQDLVRQAPNQKVIPAAEFSELLNGQELLKKIEEDMALYKKEIDEEAEKLKEEAKKLGFEEGLKEWSQKMKECEDHIASVKGEMEKMIVPVALQAAKKIVGKEMQLHPDVILDIIKQSLKSVSQHKKFTIYVNRQDLAIVDENRPKLKEGLESVESLAVATRDDIKPGDAIIETEAGIINVEQEKLWKSLEAAFSALMK
jgi:type III secretion protein L